MAYSGKYVVKNIAKYDGDYRNVRFRSLWERQVFKWLDDNKDVVAWQSEETVVPYRCKTDGKIHRYFVDIKVKFANGDTFLIEIKPKSQTIKPKVSKRMTRKYLTAVQTYIKNECKWASASSYAASRGWIFQVWTEETIKGMGIRLLT